MNAKFILAAIAAICCVQGIAAASVARPLHHFETKDIKKIELEDIDVAEVFESLFFALEQAQYDKLHPVEVEGVKGVRGTKNILTCASSLIGVFKTFKSVKEIYDEFQADQKALKEATAACSVPAAEGEATIDTATCVAEAQAIYDAQYATIQSQILPQVIKVATTLFSLKSCFSLV